MVVWFILKSMAFALFPGKELYYLLGRRLSFPVIRSSVGVCVCVNLVVCDETLCWTVVFFCLAVCVGA